MKTIIYSMILICFLAVFGGKLEAGGNASPDELKPRFEHYDGAGDIRPAPNFETGHGRFENLLKPDGKRTAFV